MLTSLKQKLPSAIERYRNEIKRVTMVVDAHLKKHGTPYLLGDKVSYADLSFIPWQKSYSTYLIPEWDYAADAPNFAAWRERLMAREAVQKIYAMEGFQFPGESK
jgi:glutathione S-transferase